MSLTLFRLLNLFVFLFSFILNFNKENCALLTSIRIIAECTYPWLFDLNAPENSEVVPIISHWYWWQHFQNTTNAIIFLFLVGRGRGLYSFLAFRDRSLFIVCEGGGRIFRGDHQIFGRTKAKSVVTENAKGGIAENFGRIQRVITQFCLKNEERGRGGLWKSSKVIRGDHFSEVTFKGGIG